MDKIKMKASAWLHSFGGGAKASNASSAAENAMSDEDFALKRIDEMLEGRKYVQLVSYVHDVSDDVLRQIVDRLPYRKLVRNMPETIVVVDALFSRIDHVKVTTAATTSGFDFPVAACEELAVQFAVLVDMGESEPELYEQEIQVCRRITATLHKNCPNLYNRLNARCKQMRNAYDSLSQHLPIGTEAQAISLQEAIRDEISNSSKDFKTSLERVDASSLKLKEFGDTMTRTGGSRTSRRSSRAVDVEATQKDITSYSQRHVQDRLIRNQTFYSFVKPGQRRGNLPALLDMLQQRVQNDKDVLTVVGQIKAELDGTGVSIEEPVAPIILRHVHAFELYLRLWNDVGVELEQEMRAEAAVLELGESVSATSITRILEEPAGERVGGSPMLAHRQVSRASSVGTSSPRFSSRSLFELAQQGGVPLPPSVVNSVATSPISSRPVSRASSFRRKESAAAAALDELERQRQELLVAYEKINQLKKREKELLDRLSEQAQRQLEGSNKFEDLSFGSRPTQVIQRYEELYSQSRVDAMDSLDDLDLPLPPGETSDLVFKSRLLFTVLEVAYKAARKTATDIKEQVRKALNAPPVNSIAVSIKAAAAKQLDTAVSSYLRRVPDEGAIRAVTEFVCGDVWRRYSDYPALISCTGLVDFMTASSRLMWELSIQSPPLALSNHAQYFAQDYHTRFYSANSRSDEIIAYIWPTLLDCDGGAPVSRGVVIT